MLVLLLPLLCAADQSYPAPRDQTEAAFTEWWAEFSQWRDETAAALNLSLYTAPGLQWAATSFIQPQVSYYLTICLYIKSPSESKCLTSQKSMDILTSRDDPLLLTSKRALQGVQHILFVEKCHLGNTLVYRQARPQKAMHSSIL
jgi:hypothetical protein